MMDVAVHLLLKKRSTDDGNARDMKAFL